MQPATEAAEVEADAALKYQTALLDNLRGRVGVLVAAAAISTSFLGAEALRPSGTPTMAWPAGAAFVAVIVTALGLLQPRTFTFTLDPLTVLGALELGESDDDLHAWLARHKAWAYASNRALIEGQCAELPPPPEIAEDTVGGCKIAPIRRRRVGMTDAFRFASFLLGLEIIFWLLALW